MGVVRKYACCRLYDNSEHYFSQSVVSVDEDGRVLEHALLTEETSFTVWIGGIIFLSEAVDMPHTKELNELLQACNSSSEMHPLYAWHISNVDFENHCLTSQSMVQRLMPDTIILL